MIDQPGVVDMWFLASGLVLLISRPGGALIKGIVLRWGGSRLLAALGRFCDRQPRRTVARIYDNRTGRKLSKVYVSGFGWREFADFARDCDQKDRRYELRIERG